MIITESQLRKIIQEETQAVLHEQVIREFQQGILEEGVKDVLQGLIKKHGQKAVMAAVIGANLLGGVSPAFAGQPATSGPQEDPTAQVAQAEVEDGYAVEGDMHMFRVTGERGDRFAQRAAYDGLMAKLVDAGGPLEGETTVHGLKLKGWENGQHVYMWSQATAAAAQRLLQMMNR